VTVVEPEPAQGRIVGESIPPDTRLLLEDLEVWSDFQDDRHEPCLGSCAAWGADSIGYNDFVLNPFGGGWHLDRGRCNRRMRDSAAKAGAHILSGRYQHPLSSSDGGGFLLRVTRHEGPAVALTARYVIDATGRSALFARATDAERLCLDQFVIISGYFRQGPQSSRSQLSLLESQPDGWWYTAAVPGGEVIVAFASDPANVRRDRLADADRWRARIPSTRHVAQRLTGCRYVPGSLTVRVAGSAIMRPTAGPGWYAVGDAASLHDPITAGGLHNALTDGIRAADAIASANTSDIGSPDANSDAEAAYDREQTDGFADYTQVRNYLYHREDRWPDSPFWYERHHATGNLNEAGQHTHLNRNTAMASSTEHSFGY
jgi:flavin-dependent dehydrogenase